jgi:hypothetical protein
MQESLRGTSISDIEFRKQRKAATTERNATQGGIKGDVMEGQEVVHD